MYKGYYIHTYMYIYTHICVCEETSYRFLVMATGGCLSTFGCRVIQKSRESPDIPRLFSAIFSLHLADVRCASKDIIVPDLLLWI